MDIQQARHTCFVLLFVVANGCGGSSASQRVDTPQPDVASDVVYRCDQPFPESPSPPAAPPYYGTAFLDRNLITDADPTAFIRLTYRGQAARTMYDRRTETFVPSNPYIFDAQFGSTVTVEVQVNSEFSREDAEREARTYATVVGRLPAFLFRDLETMWIHRGMHLFGGGNDNVLIHTAQAEQYAADGVLEEMLLHEAAHTSLDAYHASTARWQEAQRTDRVAISQYARDNPTREDVAETLGPYLAQRFFADRISPEDLVKIRAAIPARLAYFDCVGLSPALVP